MNNNSSISIIFPVYNEEDNIKKTIEDSIDFFKGQDFFSEYEIIAVDDGSTDQTPHILKELAGCNECLEIVTHSTNLGYGRALVSGERKARFSWVFIMDADGQFKINSIREMFDYILDYDIITGYRYQRSDSFYRIVLGRTYAFLACLLYGLRLKDINCGFKLFKKEALDFEGLNCHAGVFYTDIFLKARSKGCRIKEIPIEHFPRVKGKQTGASLKVVFEAVMDLFRLGFSK